MRLKPFPSKGSAVHTVPCTILLQFGGSTHNNKFAGPPTCEGAVARAVQFGLYKQHFRSTKSDLLTASLLFTNSNGITTCFM